MAKGLEEMLLSLLDDPAAAAAQADLAQAATLSRQALLLRQRAGAAAARVRRARERGAGDDEVARLEAQARGRLDRLTAAEGQAAAADLRRPFPAADVAQVFGRGTGPVEKPPLTAALLTAAGEVVVRAVATPAGAFHLTAEGAQRAVRVQLSDGAGRVLWRSAAPVDIAAGTVLHVDAALTEPEAEPGPVPATPQMPDLVGQSLGVARTLLDRLGVTAVAVEDKVADGAPDIVIAQKPRAGAALGEGAKVALTVRRAAKDTPAPRFLPGLVGRPVAEAEAALKALGLRSSQRPQADDGPPGLVLAQEPGEGTLLDGLRSVELTVSRARETPPETVVVPDLGGRSGAAAADLLKALDLGAEVTEAADPAAGPGVVAQDPAAGKTVPHRSTVRLTVNIPPAPDPGLVIVPHLTGGTTAAARKVLAALTLTAAVETADDAAAKGTVLGQDPAAGAAVAPGSTVTVVASSGTPPKVPDLASLIARMAEDPRARAADLGAAEVEGLFKTADVTTLEAARALGEASARDIAARTGLAEAARASAFRTVLRAALKALG